MATLCDEIIRTHPAGAYQWVISFPFPCAHREISQRNLDAVGAISGSTQNLSVNQRFPRILWTLLLGCKGHYLH